MSDQKQMAGSAIFIGAVIGGAIVMLLHGLPATPTVRNDWFGDQGIINTVVGTLTLCGLLFAGWQAKLSHDANVMAEVATRFQKGAELLANSDPAVAISGIAIMRQVAEDAPTRYAVPVAQVLNNFIIGKDAVGKRNARVNLSRPSLSSMPLGPSSLIEAQAFIALARIGSAITAEADRHLVRYEGRTLIESAFLSNTIFYGTPARNCHFSNLILGNVTFRGWDFTGSELHIFVRPTIFFEGCTFENTRIHIENPSAPAQSMVQFIDPARMTNSFINGVPIADWITLQPPRLGYLGH
jgi:uncharacterized protein YjbI with pentapeptide repeats